MQGNHRVQKNVGNQDEYTGRPGQDREHTLVIEGRNAVLEAFRSGRTIDKVFVLDGCQDGPVRTIIREAKKHGSILNFVGKERLAQLSQTGRHQGVIAYAAAVGLTATVAKTSAGALNYTPVAKVTNLAKTMEELKEKGIWFVCADMDGEEMYSLDLTGPVGLVIGNEGEGVSRLVKETCDFTAGIPMKGEINSLNASVAGGVLAYEIVRQRLQKAR